MTHHARLAFRCVGTAAFLCCLTANVGSAEETAKTDYQKMTNSARWQWLPELASPLWCATQAGSVYDVVMESNHKNRWELTISIMRDGRKVHSWVGHSCSVFRVLEDRLYYADFSLTSSGGKIVAVDLQTRKELWKSALQGIGLVEHSEYSNRMTLDANFEVVTIIGNESSRKYLEYKDVKTGETVGHRIFKDTETRRTER